MMRILDIDASSWRVPIDFYNALLSALGAPAWHGKNLNALVESIVWGEINAIDPPYSTRIWITQDLPADVIRELNAAKEQIQEARAEFFSRKGYDAGANFEIVNL